MGETKIDAWFADAFGVHPASRAIPAQAPGGSATGNADASGAAFAATPMKIKAKSNGDGTYTLTGTGFTPGATVSLRCADDTGYQVWGQDQDSNGTFTYTTGNVCINPGNRHFSATDSRPDPKDLTKVKWSNYVHITCGAADPPDDPDTPDDPDPPDAPPDPAAPDAPADPDSPDAPTAPDPPAASADPGTSDTTGSASNGASGDGAPGGAAPNADSTGSVDDATAATATPVAFSATAPAAGGMTPQQIHDMVESGGLSPEARDAIRKTVQDEPPPTVSRDDVEGELTKFLTKLGISQGSKNIVKTTPHGRAWEAGTRLVQGLPGATSMEALMSKEAAYKPSELAHTMVGNLPDQVPQANYDSFASLAPKDIAGLPAQSASDAIAKLFTKEVNAAVSILPKGIQDAVKKGVADAIAAGIVAIADKAMSDSPLDDKTKKAIHSLVEGLIKQKDSGPSMDRQQSGAGSPDAPPSMPPPHAPDGPPAPAVPKEQIYKTPSIPIPDTPAAVKPDPNEAQPPDQPKPSP